MEALLDPAAKDRRRLVYGIVDWFTKKASPGSFDEAGFVDNSLPSEARALLDLIAKGESGGRYGAIYGGMETTDFSKHPNIANVILKGPNAGKKSTAAGRYQFKSDTWDETMRAMGIKNPDFTPSTQDKAAWFLAQARYKKESGGGDLLSTLRSGDAGKIDEALRFLAKTWTSMQGGIEPNKATPHMGAADFMRSLPKTGAAAVAGANAPVTNRNDQSKKTEVNTSVTIGTVNVNAPDAKDAQGIAKEIPAELGRQSWLQGANQGLIG
jgi:muramidase (phage lysozyme)